MHISIDLDALSEEEQRKAYAALKLKFEPLERAEILSMDLRDERSLRYLDSRVVNMLKMRGIATLQALSEASPERLNRINGMGPKYIKQLERLCRKYGLELSTLKEA